MKKEKIILFCFLSQFACKLFAQNLVPNGQFEKIDTTICPPPVFVNIPNDCVPWIEYSSADYLNRCDTSKYVGIPQSRFGYQDAISGNGYMGLIAYDLTSFNREYIEVQLSSSLVMNQTYYVRFYISLADTMQYAIENIGMLFTDTLFDPYPMPIGTWVTGIPQVENNPGNMLNDKNNWVAITDSFVASGGEQFITIGNFRDDASTVKQYFGGTTMNTLGAYYFIEDVYVGTTPPPVGIHENSKDAHNMKLYPNPSKGNITIECNLNETETGIVFIYDLSGKLAYKYFLSSGAKTISIDAKTLKPGTYVYEIIVNDKKVKRDKLIIIK